MNLRGTQTEKNLRAAAAGEHYENTEMYPNFAQVAKKEGFAEIAGVFTMIAVAEKRHEDRYVALGRNIADGHVFKRRTPVRWVCRNCGLIREGAEAPKVCPACAKPRAFFELEAVNY
jgi:rubrerythrin